MEAEVAQTVAWAVMAVGVVAAGTAAVTMVVAAVLGAKP